MNKKIWYQVRAALVAFACLVAFTGCVSSIHKSYTVDVQSGEDVYLSTEDNLFVVEIPGESISGTGALRVTERQNAEGDSGWHVELLGGAKLVGVATLHFKHQFQDEEPAPLVLSSFAPEDKSYTISQDVQVDGEYAVVRTQEFSFWIIGWWNDILGWARNALNKAFSDTGSQPECQGEDRARAYGFSAKSDSGNAAYWCLGYENGKVILKVVNGRGWAASIKSSPGLNLLDSNVNAEVEASRFLNHVAKYLNELTTRSEEGGVVDISLPSAMHVYSIEDVPSAGVRLTASSIAYLVSIAKYAFDTFTYILFSKIKSSVELGAALRAFDLESCVSGYLQSVSHSSMGAGQNGHYVRNLLMGTLDCVSGAFGKEELGVSKADKILAGGLHWFFSGISLFANGLWAALDSAVNPDGYGIMVTGPSPENLETGSNTQVFRVDPWNDPATEVIDEKTAVSICRIGFRSDVIICSAGARCYIQGYNDKRALCPLFKGEISEPVWREASVEGDVTYGHGYAETEEVDLLYLKLRDGRLCVISRAPASSAEHPPSGYSRFMGSCSDGVSSEFFWLAGGSQGNAIPWAPGLFFEPSDDGYHQVAVSAGTNYPVRLVEVESIYY